MVTTGEPERFETYVPGLSRWFSISVFRPEAGCFAAIFENVTERKLAEQSLRESQARYQALIDTSVIAIFVIRADRVVLVNPACVRLFGAQDVEELLGRSPYELFHPDCHEQIRERIRRLRDEGEAVPLAEERIVRLDGRVVDVEVSAAPFLDQGEQAIHVVLRDVSERKAIEARLRRDEERLRLALEGAKQGLYDVDFATGEVQVSPEYARMLGHDPAGFTESVQGWIDRLHPDDRVPASDRFRDYIEGPHRGLPAGVPVADGRLAPGSGSCRSARSWNATTGAAAAHARHPHRHHRAQGGRGGAGGRALAPAHGARHHSRPGLAEGPRRRST